MEGWGIRILVVPHCMTLQRFCSDQARASIFFNIYIYIYFG